MHKTINVTLNGLIFYVEESAYKKLEAWLESIKKHFESSNDSNEIITDIESRISEQLVAKTSKAKEVVTMADIERVIHDMGTVEDFANEISSEVNSDLSFSESLRNQNLKRLYRNPDDKIIAGVASGLAAFFGVDPVWFRIAFLISIFFGGAGVLVYLILWLAMPEAKSTSQKLEMQGSPVTLQQLEKTIKEKVVTPNKSTVVRILSLPFVVLEQVIGVIKSILKMVGPIIRMFIGLLSLVVGFIGLLGFTLLLAILIFNTNSQNFDRVLTQFAQDPIFPYLVFSTYLIAAIPLLFLILLGSMLVSRKKIFSAGLNALLIGSWMVAVVFSGVLLIDSIPKIEGYIASEVDRGPEVTKNYDYKDFSYIKIDRDAHNVNIVRGDEYKISVTGPQLDVDELSFGQNGEVLYAKRHDRTICIFGCRIKPLSIDIEMPTFTGLQFNGASVATVSGFTSTSTTTFTQVILTGASKADLDISTQELDVATYNASSLILVGQGDVLNVKSYGASRVDATNYIVRQADIYATSASNIDVAATELLDVYGSSGSTITYSGDPEIIETISSSSRLRQRIDLESGL